jgi:uncharacterized protein DUF6745
VRVEVGAPVRRQVADRIWAPVCAQIQAEVWSFRQHMLRVPPEVRSPHEAVAWSFELEIHEYRPTAES